MGHIFRAEADTLRVERKVSPSLDSPILDKTGREGMRGRDDRVTEGKTKTQDRATDQKQHFYSGKTQDFNIDILPK